jgi:hypothetical protein
MGRGGDGPPHLVSVLVARNHARTSQHTPPVLLGDLQAVAGNQVGRRSWHTRAPKGQTPIRFQDFSEIAF